VVRTLPILVLLDSPLHVLGGSRLGVSRWTPVSVKLFLSPGRAGGLPCLFNDDHIFIPSYVMRFQEIQGQDQERRPSGRAGHQPRQRPKAFSERRLARLVPRPPGEKLSHRPSASPIGRCRHRWRESGVVRNSLLICSNEPPVSGELARPVVLPSSGQNRIHPSREPMMLNN
jgi:hypothetical protein